MHKYNSHLEKPWRTIYWPRGNTSGGFIIMSGRFSTTKKTSFPPFFVFSIFCTEVPVLCFPNRDLLDFSLRNSRHRLRVNDAAVTLCSVSADHEERSKKAAHFSHLTEWNKVQTERRRGLKPAQGFQVEGSDPSQHVCMSLQRAFEQVAAQYHPTRVNKEWKTLSAASVQVGGLWEAIWLRAWQQIPCWSNRWPSASWELQYVHKYLF